MKVLLKNTAKFFELAGYRLFETKNSRTSLGWKIYFYLNAINFTLVTLAVCLDVPNAAENGLKKLVSTVSIGTQFVHGAIKLMCLSLHLMKSLFQRAIVTEKNILKSNNANLKAIYMKYVKMNNKLDAFFIILVSINALTFTVTPWITKKSTANSDERLPLPLEFYLPFDYRENYKIAFVLSVIGGLVSSIYLTSSNLTYVAIMIFIISQLAILKYRVVEGFNTKRFNNEEIHQNLLQFVTNYDNLTRFVRDFNRVIKFLNLMYFLICIVHTSLIGFEVVTDTFSFQLIRNIWYLGVSLAVELCTWYWFGTKITSQHSALLNVVWESDWYNFNSRNKKILLIIMMQIQKPLRLSVGFSYYMSLETMTKILKTSMSYTITLRQFYLMKEINNQ